MEEKKFLIRFKDNRFLKSFTTDKKGDVDDITTTIHQDKAMHLNMEDAVVYKRDTFKMFKPEIVEYGTLILHIPSCEDYKLMWERKLQNSTDDELFTELPPRHETPAERLGLPAHSAVKTDEEFANEALE